MNLIITRHPGTSLAGIQRFESNKRHYLSPRRKERRENIGVFFNYFACSASLREHQYSQATRFRPKTSQNDGFFVWLLFLL